MNSAERQRTRPYLIRMFMETTADFALWGEVDRDLPTHNGNVDEGALLEDRLPISASLRERLLGWADYFRRYESGEPVSMEGFDELGLRLSFELHRELGPAYRVRYSRQFAQSREAVERLAAGLKEPGWSAS